MMQLASFTMRDLHGASWEIESNQGALEENRSMRHSNYSSHDILQQHFQIQICAGFLVFTTKSNLCRNFRQNLFLIKTFHREKNSNTIFQPAVLAKVSVSVLPPRGWDKNCSPVRLSLYSANPGSTLWWEGAGPCK